MKSLEYIKKLIQTWLIGGSMIILLLVLQTIGQCYGNKVLVAWFWAGVCLLPTLSLLWYGFFFVEQKASDTLYKKQYFVLRLLCIAYLWLVLAPLLLHPFSQMPSNKLLQWSYLWLMPIQLFILVAVGLAIFKTEINKIEVEVLRNDKLKKVNIATPIQRKKDKINIFVSYAYEDKELMEELEKHLTVFKRNGLIKTWNNTAILAGKEWNKAIATFLQQADVILLLVSADFLSNDSCYEKEVKAAIKKHKAGEAIVIPILLKPCVWQYSEFATLAVLPSNQKPITDKYWTTEAEAVEHIVQGLRNVLQELSN